MDGARPGAEMPKLALRLSRVAFGWALSLALATLQAGAAEPAQVVVLGNRTSVPVACRVAASADRAIELRLAVGEVRALRTRGPLEIRFQSAGNPRAYHVPPQSIYVFAPDGEDVDLVGIELPEATRQTAAAGDGPTLEPQPDRQLAAGALTVKLLVDDEQPRARSYWEKRLRARLEATSTILRRHAGLELKVVEVGTWTSDPAAKDLGEVLADFERHVDPAPAHLAIGFSSQLAQLPLRMHLGGLRGPLSRHLLLPELDQAEHPDLPLELLLHELGHFLGAVHSPEPLSAMRSFPRPLDPQEGRAIVPATHYDPINAWIMSLVAEELRVWELRDLVDLRPATRQSINRAYRMLHDALPEDKLLAQTASLGLVARRPAAPKAQIAPRGDEAEAARSVVLAVVAAAEQNQLLASQPATAGSAPPAAGDGLTELYYQAAAAAAAQLPEKLAPRAFLLGMGIALDRSELLRNNYLYRGLYRAVESDSERADRLRVLGVPSIWARNDLAHHFAITGLMLAAGGEAAAESAGIFKEVLDSQGSSGFSFVDLLADLAGISFAQAVLDGQIPLSRLSDEFTVERFMPEDLGLQEGLSWTQFTQAFGSTSDPRFQTELDGLRLRIRRLPVYLELARAAGDPEAEALLAQAADTGPADPVRDLQTQAHRQGRAEWGYWGAWPEKYHGWASHSNRLIPVYTFGATLDSVRGEHSPYRSAESLERLFGRQPEGTLNPGAEYFDQTDVYRLQQAAAAAGKKYIILIVFDGMDWQTTWAAATYAKGQVAYHEGRGTGLAFQDYRGATTDFGYFVTSPWVKNVPFDVDRQIVLNGGDREFGGYDFALGGAAPWAVPTEPTYLLAKYRERTQAVTDSSASATSLCAGIKTFNQAINVDPTGQQVSTIARQLQAERGFAVGVVTSVPISHATPACAYSNNVARDDFQDLTRDLLGLRSAAHPDEPLPGVDVLIGAGWGQQVATHSEQGQNYVAGNPYLTAADRQAIDLLQGGRYRVVERAEGQEGRSALISAATEAADAGQRLFGFFGAQGLVKPNSPGGHLPFRTADGRYDPVAGIFGFAERYTPAELTENPTLADCAEAALKVLEKDPEGFWLMVEAGDVDWANHDNNIDNSIGAVLSGDAAFQTIVGWVEQHQAWDDTLVILTADHGHFLNLTHPEVLVPAAVPQDQTDAAAAAADDAAPGT